MQMAMVRKHYNFPSLNGLAAFEAAGRHMSLTRAASELNVTPGAMSKQIKQLERDVGSKLFVRKHRALDLTQDGQALLAILKDSFERIAATLDSFNQSGRMRAVTIGTTNAFAQFWLMPRLGQFWVDHQDIVVDHIISDRTQDSWISHVDLRVRYGAGQFQDEASIKLFDDDICAVASPHFSRARKLDDVTDLMAQPLLSVEGADWSWTTWAEFFRAAAVAPHRLNVRRFNSYVIAVQAALDGQGIVLGWKSQVRSLLDQGRLVVVAGFEMPAPQSFYLTWSLRNTLTAEAVILKDWLLAHID